LPGRFLPNYTHGEAAELCGGAGKTLARVQCAWHGDSIIKGKGKNGAKPEPFEQDYGWVQLFVPARKLAGHGQRSREKKLIQTCVSKCPASLLASHPMNSETGKTKTYRMRILKLKLRL
jgi:hypothetical protein